MRKTHIIFVTGVFLLCLLGYILGCSELKEDALNPSGVFVRIHPDGWLSKTSADFHGAAIEQSNWDLDDCEKCHGSQYLGGTSKKSCLRAGCHDKFELHPAGWGDHTTPNDHRKAIASGNYWDITLCKRCHGSDYSGGTLKVSCLSCHTEQGGPEACNNCHGGPRNAAPPNALNFETTTSYRGVGAHQSHMLESDIAKPIKCSECHRVPTVLNSAGHLGTPAAEVSFSDTLANTRTNGVDIVANPPKLDTSKPDSIRCLNTYCHGNFTNGNKFSPIWTKVDNTQAACGTCHTLPPPPLHPPLAGCDIDCHNDEVAKVNGVLVIKDKAKHLNGKLNVFGQERVF